MQQLESDLGATLLERGRHGAELTEAGRLAAGECRVLLARYDAMRRDIAEHLGLHQGTVVLGGGATVTSSLLPSAIAAFRAEHPAIRFLVKEASSHQVVDDVVQGRIQVGIVTLPVVHEDLELTTLLDDADSSPPPGAMTRSVHEPVPPISRAAASSHSNRGAPSAESSTRP